MIQGPALEISVTLLLADLLHLSLDPYHPLQLHPVKLKGSPRVPGQLQTLPAFVIRIPDDPPLVVALDQDRSGAGPVFLGDRRQGHRVGLGELCLDGLMQPLVELPERIAVRSLLIELRLLVALPQIRHIGHLGHPPILPRPPHL